MSTLNLFDILVKMVFFVVIFLIATTVITICAAASDLLGTARTDSFQFVFTMSGCIILAIIFVRFPAGYKYQFAFPAHLEAF